MQVNIEILSFDHSMPHFLSICRVIFCKRVGVCVPFNICSGGNLFLSVWRLLSLSEQWLICKQTGYGKADLHHITFSLSLLTLSLFLSLSVWLCLPPFIFLSFFSFSLWVSFCPSPDIQKKQPDEDCPPEPEPSPSNNQSAVFCSETNSSSSQSLLLTPVSSEAPSQEDSGAPPLPAQEGNQRSKSQPPTPTPLWC